MRAHETTRTVISHIRQSVTRMSRLIDDMLDFARGRLGGGFPLERIPNASLAETIEQVIGELRDTWPNAIETTIALDHPVNGDPKSIGQLLSNLVGNALKHGAEGRPIRVLASTNEDSFEIAVINEGEPIEASIQERLFSPFFRGAKKSSNQGLGLGLYIASEIARAHGGAILVKSTKDETRFKLRMPRAASLPAR